MESFKISRKDCFVTIRNTGEKLGQVYQFNGHGNGYVKVSGEYKASAKGLWGALMPDGNRACCEKYLGDRSLLEGTSQELSGLHVMVFRTQKDAALWLASAGETLF